LHKRKDETSVPFSVKQKSRYAGIKSKSMTTQILIISMSISLLTIPFAWLWSWGNGAAEVILKAAPFAAFAENAWLLYLERVTDTLYLGSMAFSLSVLFVEFCCFAYTLRNA